MTDTEYILNQIPEEVLFAQLAEEAAELAQAALKVYRILDGRNPARVRLSEARANLMEEVADIINCLQMLSISPNASDYQETIRQKIERWAGHLREHTPMVPGHEDGKPKWIPASEPPKVWKDENGDAINFLIFTPNIGIDIGNWIEPMKMWFCLGIPYKVTHWMPLPEEVE